jgi:trk system potassium uptake protein TrkA
MHVIIVGGGDVGWNLAQELSLMEFQNVTLIESDAFTHERSKDKLNISAVLGDGTNPKTLLDAGIKKAELLIAVTNSDEVNLVISMWGQYFKVKHTIARVHKKEYTQYNDTSFHNHINHLISTEKLAIEHTLRLIRAPGAVDVADFANGKILLREFEVTEESPIAHKTLAEINASADQTFLIVGIEREDQLSIPTGKDNIKPQDRIFVILPNDFLPLFTPMVKPRTPEYDRIIIFGGTRIGIDLASKLENKKKVTLIEPREKEAERCSHLLENTEVLVGSPSEREILQQAHIEKTDVFIACAEQDQENLFAALIAKRYGAKLTIVISSDPQLSAFLREIGIDTVINPKMAAVASIISYVRRGVKSMVLLSGLNAEVCEMIPMAGSPILNKPLSQLDFPKQAIIGAVLRGGEPFIPEGKTQILPEDSVIVFALPSAQEAIEKMFNKRKGFFGLI